MFGLAPTVSPVTTLAGEYHLYVQSLKTNGPIEIEESDAWIARFRTALAQSKDPLADQIAWEVLISHLNYHARWAESLKACESAIGSAVQESVRFARIYDKYTVLAAIAAEEGPEGLRGDQDAVRLAADDVIRQFDSMMKSKDPAAASVWSLYASVAWARLNDTAVKDVADQEALGRNMLAYGHTLPIRLDVYDDILANALGTTAGIAMAGNPQRAAKLIAEYADRPVVNAASLAVALATAGQHGASQKVQNEFLWAIRDPINDDDLLGAALRHARDVMIEARRANDAPMRTESHDELAGVPLEDMTDMIAPLVDDLIVRFGGRSLPPIASKMERRRWEHAKSGAMMLANLYEIDGQQELASYYRELFTRIPMGAPKSVRP